MGTCVLQSYVTRIMEGGWNALRIKRIVTCNLSRSGNQCCITPLFGTPLQDDQ
jgi:hypothetical protein